MKKYFFYALMAFSVSAVCSCNKEATLDDTPDKQVEANPINYTCSIANLDTKLAVDEAGKTTWEDGDKIVIHGHKVEENLVVELHDFTNDGKDASFTADLSGIRGVSDTPGAYYVSYPADAYVGLSGSDAGYNGYYSGFGDTNHPLLAGYLDGTEFKIFNLCGVLTFKVDGDYDGYIFEGNRAETVSYDAYRVKITSDTQDFKSWKTEGDKASIQGKVIGDGITLNYIYFPSGASFPNGFTLYLMKEGVIKGYLTGNSSISIDRGHQKNMGLLPAGKIHARPMILKASEAVDLNNYGGAKQKPANSYLLVRNSTYRDKTFKIWAVKGNDLSQSIEGIASVEVLWESRCQGSSNSKGILVKEVDFDKNHIYFKTPAGDDFKDGNAVIAAKDSEGNILWSWHIWVSSTAVTDIQSDAVSKTAVMDRNLGAGKVASMEAYSDIMSYGLLYQWGRKDPFPGAKYVESGSLPGYYSEYEFSVNNGKISLDYSIKNPMVIGWEAYNKDWCTSETTDATFWSDYEKTIYDPCPSGYRVMKRDYNNTQIWSDTYKSDLSTVTGWAIGDTYCFTFGEPAVSFPLAGYRENSTSTSNPGKRAGVWSAKSSSESAYFLNIRHDSSYYKRESTGKARSYSVRCEREP